jgi:general secretion pathway protein G
MIAWSGIALSPCVILPVIAGGERIPARYVMATLQVENLAQAVERYRADCGTYPSAREGLNSLTLDQGVPGWHGPYLTDEIPLDPWHNPYVYSLAADSTTPEILSFGAD